MERRDAALDGLEGELGALVRRVRRAWWEKAGDVVLAHIVEHGPMRAADLRGALGIDKAAVSRHVQQLLEMDRVAAAADPQDGRATLLTATQGGRAHLREVVASRRVHLEGALSRWRTDELESFVEALGRYNADLSL